jgi:hypothetical protein
VVFIFWKVLIMGLLLGFSIKSYQNSQNIIFFLGKKKEKEKENC